MDVSVQPVITSRDLRAFLDVPRRIYANDPCWPQPLAWLARCELDQQREPFWRHAEGALFVAWRDGQPVGRISAQHDRLRAAQWPANTGSFGYFECEHNHATAAALFAAAADWLRARGLQRMRGPLSPSTHGPTGFLIEGCDRPPAFMMPCNPPYYAELAAQCGLSGIKDLLDYDKPISIPTPAVGYSIVERMRRNPRVRLRRITQFTLHRDVEIVRRLYNECWADNWGFTPLTREEARSVAAFWRLFGHPETSLLAYYDGEPVGMYLAVPDINEALLASRGWPEPLRVMHLLARRRRMRRARTLMIGVKEHVRHLGMVALLYVEADTFLRQHYQHLHFGWVLDDNEAANEMMDFVGGVPRRRYRIFEREL